MARGRRPSQCRQGSSGIAIYQRNKGDLSESQKSFAAALLEFRRIGANWDIASCSHNLAMLLQEQGDLEGARQRMKELPIKRGQIYNAAFQMSLRKYGSMLPHCECREELSLDERVGAVAVTLDFRPCSIN